MEPYRSLQPNVGLLLPETERLARRIMVLPTGQATSEEAVEIVQRAALLEASNPTSTMTLGGVEALCAEVGISPELVRSAARVAGPRTAGSGTPAVPTGDNRWAGGPIRILIERMVDGELPETSFLYVVEEIRQVLGTSGQVSQLGRSFAWSMGIAGKSGPTT